MRYVVWLLRLIIFIVLLGFALQNTELVTLNVFSGYYWRAPLIFIVLACFIAGIIFGVGASLSYMIALRRKLIVARKKLKEKTLESTSNTVSQPIFEPPRDAL